MTNLISVVVIAVNIVTNYTTARMNEKFTLSKDGGSVCATLCYDSEEQTVESVETNVVLGAQIGSNLVTLGQIRVHNVTEQWWRTNLVPPKILFDDDLVTTSTSIRVRARREW